MESNYVNWELTASVKQLLMQIHPLKYLFFELTQHCNLRCAHCGSRCPDYAGRSELSAENYKSVVDRVAQAVPTNQLMFCITGGEPLLNKDWFEICSYITQKGFSWGMTSNGTLIDEVCVRRLAQAEMKTVSISLDGLKESHEQLRGVPGCFDQAVNAIRLLKNSGLFRAVQVVTVVNRLNYAELPRLYELVKSLNVDSWKLTPIEPMGKAKEVRGFFLSPGEHYQLLGFIKSKRQTAPFEVTYGCSHLLPEEYDSTVRKQPFLCGAGTMIASIASNGDILPCLDIDCRDHVKQGNILQDDFVDVWENKFELFRRNKANTSPTCRDCKLKQVCQGDSWHSWDFEENVPQVCFQKHIFF